jgi:hypothetical protein
MTTSGLIGAAAVWLAGYFNNKHERKRKEFKEDEQSIVAHLTQIEERCNQENKELKTDLKFTNKRLQQVLAHLMYLEGILETKGVKFRRLEMDDIESVDIGNHKAITGQSGTVPKSSPRIREQITDSDEGNP